MHSSVAQRSSRERRVERKETIDINKGQRENGEGLYLERGRHRARSREVLIICGCTFTVTLQVKLF